MDGASQLLSLKVMRVSRPHLASAWAPFYSSSPSFSAHSTGSIMSLQGKAPLPGYPKTLRDLTHISEVLTLPSSFGAIQLGETFSSCLSVNNETNLEIDGVTLTVEMQTATTKTVLAEFGGPDHKLAVGDSLEQIISHEIKELGQHVLGCTVSYHVPTGIRMPPTTGGDLDQSQVQSFRKFYKFAVTNPLSVKTKVHLPRAPSALLARNEREKVFLEVHIQNLTQDAMWLERMQFECADGWQAHDANRLDSSADADEKEDVFSVSAALMHPQDLRQYIYILSPKHLAPFPVHHPPGSIVPLGRLDISWRSSFGEPGRLLTSMLSRRIPLIQAQVPSAQPPPPPPKQPSAIPLHLQRSATVASGTPPRPRSPQLNRPTSPPVNPTASPAPYRPGSPFRSRTLTSGSGTAVGAPSPTVPPTSPNPAVRRPEDVEVDLVVRHILREQLAAEQPFTIAFTASVAAAIPIPRPGEARKQRVLSLVVQHLRPPRPTAPMPAAVALAAAVQETWSPRLPSSGFSTPSPSGTPFRGDFQDTLAQRLLTASPRRALDGDDHTSVGGGDETPGPHTGGGALELPPPFLTVAPSEEKVAQVRDVVYLGGSAVFLPQMRLVPPLDVATPDLAGSVPGHARIASDVSTDSEASEEAHVASSGNVKVVASQDFELTYIPLKSGFVKVGGLRVLLVEDRIVDEAENGARRYVHEPKTLKEWEVVDELWIPT